MPYAAARRAAEGGSPRRDPLLTLGLVLPGLYFAIQLAAAPFYPGYSFLNRDASTLGSAGSTAPWIFNAGALLVGAVEVLVAVAFFGALRRARIGVVLAGLYSLALLSAAIGSVNAFLHPLPDPRHTEGLLSLLGAGPIVLTPLSIAVLWRLEARRLALLVAVLCLAVVPVMTGLVQRLCIQAGIEFDVYQALLNGYHGLIQRLGALLLFGPIAVIAHVLRRAEWTSTQRERARALPTPGNRRWAGAAADR
jgi:hypothetical protein